MTLQNSFGTQLIEPTQSNTIVVQRLSFAKKRLALNYISSDIIKKYPSEPQVNQLLLTQLFEREGCRLVGYIMIDKAPGALYFFLNIRQYELMKNIYSEETLAQVTFTHKVNFVTLGHLTDQDKMVSLFGKSSVTDFNKARDIPTQIDVNFCLYYFPLVPHMFSIGKEKINKETYQYAVNFHCQHNPISIAAYQITFAYSIKPVGIYYSKEEYTLLQMITTISAIVTGVYVILGMIKNAIDN